MRAATSPHAVDATMSLALCLLDGVEETVQTTSTPSMRHHVRHLARAGGRDGHTVTPRVGRLGGVALSKANKLLETSLLQTTINIRANEDTGACASAQPEKAIATSE